MRSMTGFGTGEGSAGGLRLVAEIRSLNHRFVDVRVRMPTELSDQGFYVEQWCRENLSRGRYDVSVRAIGNIGNGEMDLQRAERVFETFCKLRDRIAPKQEVPISLLASVPDLMHQTSSNPADLRAGLIAALKASQQALTEMRSTEGDALRAVMAKHLQKVHTLHAWLTERAPELSLAFRARLRARINKIASEEAIRIDPERVDAEVVVYADKSDIAEELARLESHFVQFGRLLEQDEPVGRRLDFLLQEIGREANTVGAKCNDASVSHKIVELKAELERMREQVQNVE